MLITIRHKLKIGFDKPAARVLLHLLMTPQTGPSQRIAKWSLAVEGATHEVPLTDGFGNKVLFAALTGVEAPIEITASGIIETRGGNGVLGWPTGEPVPWLYHRMTAATRVPVSVWGKFRGEASQRDGQLGVLHGLMARINEMHAADQAGGQNQSQSSDSGAQSQLQGEAEGDAERRSAVAFTESFVGAARGLGIPARFVSGYLLSDEAGIESGPHAWAEAYVEGLGWVGFDAMLDMCPTGRHVRVAVGLDAETAAAVRTCPEASTDAIPVETVEIAVAEAAAP